MEEQELSDKQKLIMETAERLFATNGYDATSIRDIAAAGSFNSAMISYYFGSKEQLMEGILVYRTTKLETVATDLLTTLTDPLEKLLAINHFYVQKVLQHKYFYLLIFQIQSLPDKHVLIRNFYNTLRYKNFELLNTIIKDGQNRGLFKTEINTSFLLFVISGTMNNFLVNQDYYKDVNHKQGLSNEEFDLHIKEALGDLLTGIIKNMVLLP
jgi:AcrR family transcriptional regulator